MTNVTELSHVIGGTILHSVWQLSLIALVLSLLLRAMRQRSASARYGVACLLMALIPVVACATFSVINDANATSHEIADNQVGLCIFLA